MLLVTPSPAEKSHGWCDRRVLMSFSLRRSFSTTAQELLAAAHNGVSGHLKPINPIFRRPVGADDPPSPGPATYKSAESNPLSTPDSVIRSAYRFDCHSSRNNTITTLSSLTYDKDPFKPPRSNVIAWYSGGSLKFKKSQRASYEAGYQCVIHVFKLLEKLKQEKGSWVTVELYFNGFGQGREALKTALMATEGVAIRDTIRKVTDCTPLKIGGTRSKKTRRL